jgi:hypothetical protein
MRLIKSTSNVKAEDIEVIENLKAMLLNKIDSEISGFCDRRQPDPKEFFSTHISRENILETLSPHDQKRYECYLELRQNISNICNERINERQRAPLKMDQTDFEQWKHKSKNELMAVIQKTLEANTLKKECSQVKKFSIWLLNTVSFILSPIALPVKKAITNTFFYSLTGKLQTSAEDCLEIIKKAKL